jgi:hypothetical protein
MRWRPSGTSSGTSSPSARAVAVVDTPVPRLDFGGGTCPDCAVREVTLPGPLPTIGDDVDWQLRDYDGFRLFMLGELIGRFPERTRWTPADLEVVLVEALAAVLDQLSDTLDRVAAEAYLETARQPRSVRRLLAMIGYDPARLAGPAAEKLEQSWAADPRAMEAARAAGPGSVHTQRRMVTVDDYAARLAEHPLVLRASASSPWTGSWTTVTIAVVLDGNRALDAALTPDETDPVRAATDRFHQAQDLPPVPWSDRPTTRIVLHPYLEAFRMIGQDTALVDAIPVAITIALAVRVAANYFSSEVRRAVAEALGTGPSGFFRPGRLRFGEDLNASDVIETVMRLPGVDNVCLNRFKRVGVRHPDQVASGRIVLDGLEIAVCDNARDPRRGTIRLVLHGGRPG